jgi:Glycosyl hydrolases family 16
MKSWRAAAGGGAVLIVGAGALLGVAAAAHGHTPQSAAAPAFSSGPPERSPRIAGAPGQLMPVGVPASQVGKLLVNDTGVDLARWSGRQHGGSVTDHNGVLGLSTSGAPRNGYSIISPNTYTSGIIEARIYFPGGTNGKIADWPAFWLSSAWSGAVSWPDGGEMDLAEGLHGDLCVTYHYGVNGRSVSTWPFGVTSAPGWHVVTGVWSAGQWDVYYDGKLAKAISGSFVVNDPMNIILSAYQGRPGNHPGVPATLEVSYLRVWSLAGS